MDLINLKSLSSHFSIQQGFEWSSIPSFAIITGVNGAGKTHLLNLLKSEEKEITNSENLPFELITTSNWTTPLNIEGLIIYKNQITQRLAKKKELEENITQYQAYAQDKRVKIVRTTDKIEVQQLKNKLESNINQIKRNKKELKNLFIYPYEQELIRITKITKKNNIEDISDTEIREFGNPFFNSLTEISDFENFIKQEEQIRNNRFIKLIKENRENEIALLKKEERAHEKINRLFTKYGFSYYEMLDPFPTDNSRNGQIIFQGGKGEQVQYNSLSSGEQMIVKFIIWSMARDIRGRQINTMLLDEPDAHLHPSMCKMMIEILHEITLPKEQGGSDIRVIITTHSPSTVALAPNESLYVLEKDDNLDRVIRPTSTEEAVNILSEGIFTYNKAINQFSMAITSEKDFLIFVEGKTDVKHLNQANKILGYNLSFEVIDMHDAGALANFIKSTPAKFFNGKKLIALFDADPEGFGSLKSISGDTNSIEDVKIITATQCENKSYAMTLIAPPELYKYCPIEFLYNHEYLNSHKMLCKRNYQEYQTTYKPSSIEEAEQLNEEYSKETGLRPFKVNDSKKDYFSQICSEETNPEVFKNFIPTLEKIKQIIEYEN